VRYFCLCFIVIIIIIIIIIGGGGGGGGGGFQNHKGRMMYNKYTYISINIHNINTSSDIKTRM
jgi:hypothetical protein